MCARARACNNDDEAFLRALTLPSGFKSQTFFFFSFLSVNGYICISVSIYTHISDNGDLKTLFKSTKEYFDNRNTDDKNNDMIFDETDIVKVAIVSPVLKEVNITNNTEEEAITYTYTNSRCQIS